MEYTEEVEHLRPLSPTSRQVLEETIRRHKAAQLAHAAFTEDANRVKELLSERADPNVADSESRWPLTQAAFAGEARVVSLLLEARADPNLPQEGDRAIHVSAWQGDKAVTKLLLTSSADVEATDSNGCSPLCGAALKGHVAVVELLLNHGADPTRSVTVSGHGTLTPLKAAQDGHSAKVVEKLKEAIAAVPPRSRNSFGLSMSVPSPLIKSRSQLSGRNSSMNSPDSASHQLFEDNLTHSIFDLGPASAIDTLRLTPLSFQIGLYSREAIYSSLAEVGSLSLTDLVLAILRRIDFFCLQIGDFARYSTIAVLPGSRILPFPRTLWNNWCIFHPWLSFTPATASILDLALHFCSVFLALIYQLWIPVLCGAAAVCVRIGAGRAAQKNDLFGLYQLINKFSPKQRRSRIQLRSTSGAIASPAEEMSILRAYVKQTWFDPTAPDLLQLCLPVAPGVPFTVEDLTRELQKLPLLKAVASPYPPNIMWRAQAAHIAAIAHADLTRWWNVWPPYVPPAWQRGWLVFIGKPNKPPNAAGNLRALAMLEPLGKAVLCLLTRQLQSSVFHKLAAWPQMAYMQFRDTQDALIRVVTHCKQVQTLVQSHTNNLRNQRAGAAQHTCFGGVQLFVDLEKAFDTAPRLKVIRALQALDAPAALISLFAAWHNSTSYVLTHHDMEDTQDTNQGVRQGCVAAPALWACLMHLLLTTFGQRVPTSWIKGNMTIFADDIHLCQLIKCPEDLEQAIQIFGLFFTCAQEFGLQINFRKTEALLRLSGPWQSSVQSKHVLRTTDGVFLPFRAVHFATDSTDGMPFCHICNLSFTTWKSFQTHMSMHVETVSTQASVMELDRHLTTPPVLHAGQPATDSAASDRSPGHSEIVPAVQRSELFAVARATDVGARAIQLVLDQNWQGIKADEEAKHWLCNHCVICNVYLGSLKRMNSHMRLQHAQHSEGLFQMAGSVLKRCATISPCEFCNKTFVHDHLCPVTIQAAMILLHEMPSAMQPESAGSEGAAQRRPKQLVVRDFVPVRDSLNGAPTCSHCRRQFQSFSGLRHHIALDKCHQFDVHRSLPPVVPDVDMLTSLKTGTLMAWLREDAHRRMQWSCHCQTCGHKYTTAANLANHLQLAHSELWHASTTCTSFLHAYALEETSRDPALVTSFHTMKQMPLDLTEERQHGLALDRCPIQTGQSQAQQLGCATGLAASSPPVIDFLAKDDLRLLLTQLRLRNAANFCYCNATMCCIWWSILCRRDYQCGDWGSGEQTMRVFFSQLTDAPKSVQEGFPALFSMWNHGNLPADAAEFAYFVLRWMGMSCVSHKWGRFYMAENERLRHDYGDEHAPIFLQVPHHAITSVCLQDLITRWTQEYGMQTALYEASDVLFCHIDRNAHQPDGSLSKLQFWLHADHVCSLPVFSTDGLQVSHDYIPVAMLAHLGDDITSGHYRAALRMTAGDGDQSLSTHHTVWAITDDNQLPTAHPLPGMPEWLCRNMTLVCLVRLEKLDLFRPLRDPGAGWLRLRELRRQMDLLAATDVQLPQVQSTEPDMPHDVDMLPATPQPVQCPATANPDVPLPSVGRMSPVHAPDQAMFDPATQETHDSHAEMADDSVSSLFRLMQRSSDPSAV
eukprot:s576_g16.t1